LRAGRRGATTGTARTAEVTEPVAPAEGQVVRTAAAMVAAMAEDLGEGMEEG